MEFEVLSMVFNSLPLLYKGSETKFRTKFETELKTEFKGRLDKEIGIG
jgi:hypothetical protein